MTNNDSKKKKKTSVMLPGSLSDLVRDLQNGGPQAQKGDNNAENTEKDAGSEISEQKAVSENRKNDSEAQNVVAQEEKSTKQPQRPLGLAASKNTAQEAGAQNVGRGSEQGKEIRPNTPENRVISSKADQEREYAIQKDDSADSWDLFLDLAKQYRDSGSKLATIYIDGTLKNILDRMKYAGPEKLSTSAILSSIVARFIYDHDAEIRKTLFENNLF